MKSKRRNPSAGPLVKILARYKCPEVMVWAIEKPLVLKQKLTISVSKKTGTAVQRNRLRRVIREYFDKNPNTQNLWVRFPSGFRIQSPILSKDWHQKLRKMGL